jgi:predicted HTH transcriptional regulator
MVEIGLGVLVIITAFVSGYTAVVIGAVSLIGLGAYRMRPRPANNQEEMELRRAHLDSIMTLARQGREFANADVQAALGVSAATAERYLQELEAQGRIVQVGDTGRGVVYRLNK